MIFTEMNEQKKKKKQQQQQQQQQPSLEQVQPTADGNPENEQH